MAHAKQTLQTLEVQPMYILPQDPLSEQVLIPGFKAAHGVDCMVGFFSSDILATLAPGLATYIANSDSIFRLIISPMLSKKDQTAIKEGLKSAEDTAIEIFSNLAITEDLLQQHTLKCLSYLLQKNRIIIKVALLESGIFHPKIWLFTDNSGTMAAHGSSNGTVAGIRKNLEQVVISKSWDRPDGNYIINKHIRLFKELWNNNHSESIVIDMPKAIRDNILKTYNAIVSPTEEDYRKIMETRCSNIPFTKFSTKFKLPNDLNLYEHQTEAINSWMANGYNGILEMATGSGKTFAALCGTHKLYKIHRPMLVVVAVPYKVLVEQWCDEINKFGLNATILGRNKKDAISTATRRLDLGVSDIEIMVVTHNAICNPELLNLFKKYKKIKLLIADEVHGLGQKSFLNNLPEFFEYRLGLSATPERQYDEEGTDALFKFFGQVVFKYGLEKAIGTCLVNYEYNLHPIELTYTEMEKWLKLTNKINQNMWRKNNDTGREYLDKLLRDRRVIVETAAGKVTRLKELLKNIRDLRYTIIYATDKNPKQLDEVNALLNEKGVMFRQLTYKETTSKKNMDEILKLFQNGNLDVLTAKRVLDEGVDIPQIRQAFMLASTTVERQWVQRRGRVLRKYPGKNYAIIHDFLVVPPKLDAADLDAKLFESELRRALKFANLARNITDEDGPLNVIYKIWKA